VSFDGFDPIHPNHSIRFSTHTSISNDMLEFLAKKLYYAPELLSEQLENCFQRITLVNKGKTERLTIDSHLSFNNLQTGKHFDLPDIAIIELKRDGLVYSPILSLLRQLRIHPMGFSKYVLGTAFTNENLKQNCLKQKLHRIEKMEIESFVRDSLSEGKQTEISRSIVA
jgi:predicted oxidoreductase